MEREGKDGRVGKCVYGNLTPKTRCNEVSEVSKETDVSEGRWEVDGKGR